MTSPILSTLLILSFLAVQSHQFDVQQSGMESLQREKRCFDGEGVVSEEEEGSMESGGRGSGGDLNAISVSQSAGGSEEELHNPMNGRGGKGWKKRFGAGRGRRGRRGGASSEDEAAGVNFSTEANERRRGNRRGNRRGGGGRFGSPRRKRQADATAEPAPQPSEPAANNQTTTDVIEPLTQGPTPRFLPFLPPPSRFNQRSGGGGSRFGRQQGGSRRSSSTSWSQRRQWGSKRRWNGGDGRREERQEDNNWVLPPARGDDWAPPTSEGGSAGPQGGRGHWGSSQGAQGWRDSSNFGRGGWQGGNQWRSGPFQGAGGTMGGGEGFGFGLPAGPYPSLGSF